MSLAKRMKANAARFLEDCAELGRTMRGDYDRLIAAAEAIGALWDIAWPLYYHEDICESHGEVEDVFV